MHDSPQDIDKAEKPVEPLGVDKVDLEHNTTKQPEKVWKGEEKVLEDKPESIPKPTPLLSKEEKLAKQGLWLPPL